jgi:hypothetical protein
MKHKYKVIIAYLIYALLGMILGCLLAIFLKSKLGILWWSIIIVSAIATCNLPQYIIKKIK